MSAAPIVIVLEGGLVSAVWDGEQVRPVVVIDYDVDGIDPAELEPVPQDSRPPRPPGETADAYVHVEMTLAGGGDIAAWACQYAQDAAPSQEVPK